MSYFFDTYAIIELTRGNPKYEFVKEEVISTCVLNLAEFYYYFLLKNKKDLAIHIMNSLNLELLDIDKETVLKAVLFRFKNKKLKLSYIDCIGYILSLKNKMEFLTGDKGFKKIKNVKFVKK